MQIRIAAIDFVRELNNTYDNSIPRKVLKRGFDFQNKTITLVNQPGIWKPAACKYPISITTTLRSKYNDKQIGEYLEYSYCGENPLYRDNVGLREAMKYQIPLIYFIETVTQRYMAQFPAYISSDDINNLKFRVKFDELNISKEKYEVEDIRRSYVTREVKQRIHQTIFRERILQAYQCQCSLCRLKHRELLDAAHIIPDSEVHGVPEVTNGLSLCKIHHTAYDRNIIGITPDYKIKIREDILLETDGPMLKYGIQKLDNQKIILPDNKKDWPDQERLEERFVVFNSV